MSHDKSRQGAGEARISSFFHYLIDDESSSDEAHQKTERRLQNASRAISLNEKQEPKETDGHVEDLASGIQAAYEELAGKHNDGGLRGEGSVRDGNLYESPHTREGGKE